MHYENFEELTTDNPSEVTNTENGHLLRPRDGWRKVIGGFMGINARTGAQEMADFADRWIGKHRGI